MVVMDVSCEGGEEDIWYYDGDRMQRSKRNI